MTAFAATLFTLGVIASLLVLGSTLRQHAADVIRLRRAVQSLPDTDVVSWSVVERPADQVPPGGCAVRPPVGRQVRPYAAAQGAFALAA